jgi:hypothetical protein
MPPAPGRPGYTRPAGNAVAARGADIAVPGGDSITHGEQDRVAQAVIAAMARVHQFQQAMEANLTAAECPEDMIAEVAAWSDRWDTAMRRIREGLNRTNARLDPYVDAVESLPRGWRDSASAGYLSDV